MKRPICGHCPECREATLGYLAAVKKGTVRLVPRAAQSDAEEGERG